MSPNLDGQIRELDLHGFFRGRVVKNDDPKMEGRLGLFIPALVVDMPDHLEAPAPIDNPVEDSLFANGQELQLRGTVKEDNYLWARPCAWLVENSRAAKNVGGSFRVPRVGTMVLVFFEGADPNRPYWMPFTPTVEGDVIQGGHLGKGLNMDKTAQSWTDAKKRVEVHVLAEHDNGNVVLMDSNADTNSFVIRFANGHTLSIGHAAESGIVLQTEKGHLVQLDENSGEIRVRTHTGQASAVLADSGNITAKCSANLSAEAGGNVSVQAGGSLSAKSGGPTSIDADGAVTIKSGASITLQAPSIALLQG